MKSLVHLPHRKCNDFIFKTSNETRSPPLCNIAFLAVNKIVKTLKL